MVTEGDKTILYTICLPFLGPEALIELGPGNLVAQSFYFRQNPEKSYIAFLKTKTAMILQHIYKATVYSVCPKHLPEKNNINGSDLLLLARFAHSFPHTP